MTQFSKEIAKEIDEIANKRHGGLRFPVMSGTIVSVDEDEMTAVVRLSVDDEDVPTEDICVNVLLENAHGIYGIPPQGAACLVAEVDGPGKWEVLKCSKYTNVYVKAENTVFINGTAKIQLRDGSLEGLVIVAPLIEKLNNLENDLNDLKNDLSSFLASVAASVAASPGAPVINGDLSTWLMGAFTAYIGHMLVPTEQVELENRAVTHG